MTPVRDTIGSVIIPGLSIVTKFREPPRRLQGRNGSGAGDCWLIRGQGFRGLMVFGGLRFCGAKGSGFSFSR